MAIQNTVAIVTTVTIAKRAGVSQATVSRVLNGATNVAPKTLRLVERVIKEIGYQHVPRRKIQRPDETSQLVAALILNHDQFHNYASTCWLMLQGAQEALQKNGMNLLIAHTLSPDQIPPVVMDHKVAGLLLIGQHPDGRITDCLSDIPMVWLTTRQERHGDYAVPGNEQVGRIAAEYLIGRGHKQLGIIDTLVGSPAVEIRRRSFQFNAMQAKIPVQEFISDSSVYTARAESLNLSSLEERVATQVDRYLAAANRPTGLFVPMDMQLAIVYRILAKRQVKIGRDLEMIGSDDEKAALMGLYPRPATISIGPSAMGRRAVEQLIWRISNRSVKERIQVMVEPELIPGDPA